jgi:DNA-directed RNA polymerase specialized sigma24 family protein
MAGDIDALYSRFSADLERAIRAVLTRHGPYDLDVAQEIRLRVCRDGCAALGRIHDEADSFPFLYGLAARTHADRTRRERGRFRSSVAARRLGPVAVQIERLVMLDGLTVEAACDFLADNRDVQGEAAWERLVGELRSRAPRPPSPRSLSEADARLPAGDRDPEQQLVARVVITVVRAELESLSSETRALLAARFGAGSRLPEVAAARGVGVKKLYRDSATVCGEIGTRLRSSGIEWRDVEPVLSDVIQEIEVFGGRDGIESAPPGSGSLCD